MTASLSNFQLSLESNQTPSYLYSFTTSNWSPSNTVTGLPPLFPLHTSTLHFLVLNANFHFCAYFSAIVSSFWRSALLFATSAISSANPRGGSHCHSYSRGFQFFDQGV